MAIAGTASRVVEAIGVGIDTARYGHCAVFLRDDQQLAARRLEFRECREGYDKLQASLEGIRQRFPAAQIRVRIDAAGQYARNLEGFLRSLPLELSVSVGEPQRNRNYRLAHMPSKKSDKAKAEAMARFAVLERRVLRHHPQPGAPGPVRPSAPRRHARRHGPGALQAQVAPASLGALAHRSGLRSGTPSASPSNDPRYGSGRGADQRAKRNGRGPHTGIEPVE